MTITNVTLNQKLFMITHELKSITQEKPKGISYKVTSWNEVNNIVKDVLSKYHVLIIPKVLDHEKNGNLTVVTINADIVDISTNEKIVVGNYVGYGVDQSDKGVGKAISYAYKYLLMKLFMMDIGTDEDSEYSNPPVNQTLGRNEI